jgi:hypothetical protein
MNGKFLLFGRDEIENSLGHFVDRKIREQRGNERRFAEQRTTKHRIQARKSCIADARSYRVARRLPVLAVAQFDRRIFNSIKAVREALEAGLNRRYFSADA